EHQAGHDAPGCEAAELEAERPMRRVFVRAFAIDRLEVSNADHRRCVSAGACSPARSGAVEPRAELPVVQLTWREARAYCRFVGGELPTEAQWEYAAHGSSERSFPWGHAWDQKLAAFGTLGSEPQPVRDNSGGKSFFGLLNMAGNVAELVLDRYHAPYDLALPSVDPVELRGPQRGGERVLRGGSWRSPPVRLRTRARAAIAEDEARDDVGLRCAYPVAPAPL
ncbi:MAG: formylglycine-generating enzyme family protein, partial [Polyangiales bacterium]